MFKAGACAFWEVVWPRTQINKPGKTSLGRAVPLSPADPNPPPLQIVVTVSKLLPCPSRWNKAWLVPGMVLSATGHSYTREWQP